MQLTIRITCDNAAFEDHPIGEIERVLKQLIFRLAYVWGGRAPRAVAARSDSAIFPGFFSIPCSVFRNSVVTIFRDLS